MDGLSAASSAITLAELAWKLGKGLYQFVQATKHVSETVKGFVTETEQLGNVCNSVGQQIKLLPSLGLSDNELLSGIDAQLQDCAIVIEKLERALGPVIEERDGWVRQAIRQRRLDISEHSILDCKKKLSICLTNLGLTLQLLNIKATFLAPRLANEALLEKLAEIQHSVEEHGQLLNRNLVSCANDYFTQGTTLYSESIAPASVVGVLPTSKFTAIADWVGMLDAFRLEAAADLSTVDSNEGSSSIGLPPAESLTTTSLKSPEDQGASQAPTEEEHERYENIDSDDDNELAQEVASAALDSGREAFSSENYKEADGMLTEGLILIKTLPKQMRQEHDLEEIHYKLAVCAYHIHDLPTAEAALVTVVKRESVSNIDALRKCDAGVLLAQVYIRAGKLDAARATSESVWKGRRRLLKKDAEPCYESLGLLIRSYHLLGNNSRANTYRYMLPADKREHYSLVFDQVTTIVSVEAKNAEQSVGGSNVETADPPSSSFDANARRERFRAQLGSIYDRVTSGVDTQSDPAARLSKTDNAGTRKQPKYGRQRYEAINPLPKENPPATQTGRASSRSAHEVAGGDINNSLDSRDLVNQSARLREEQLRRDEEKLREIELKVRREIEDKRLLLSARESELQELETRMTRGRSELSQEQPRSVTVPSLELPASTLRTTPATPTVAKPRQIIDNFSPQASNNVKDAAVVHPAFGYITCIAQSYDGRLIACGYGRGTVRLFDAKSEDVDQTFNDDRQADVNCIAFSPDGKYLAASVSLHVSIWSLSDGTHFRRLGWTKDQDAKHLAISADGRYLASAHSGYGLRIWDVGTGSKYMHWKPSAVDYAQVMFGYFTAAPVFLSNNRVLATLGKSFHVIQLSNKKTAKMKLDGLDFREREDGTMAVLKDNAQFDLYAGTTFLKTVGPMVMHAAWPNVHDVAGGLAGSGDPWMTAMGWRPNNNPFAIVLRSNKLAICAVDKGRWYLVDDLLPSFGQNAESFEAADLSQDSSTMVTRHTNGAVIVWDVEQLFYQLYRYATRERRP